VRELASYLQSAIRDQRIRQQRGDGRYAWPCPFLLPRPCCLALPWPLAMPDSRDGFEGFLGAPSLSLRAARRSAGYSNASWRMTDLMSSPWPDHLLS
jgi:hypothetical protein